MCGIKYAYDKNDSLALALQKVLKELRETHHLRIYNFHVSTTDEKVDVDFLEYAAAHKQCNAENANYFHGSLVFTGRCDTAIRL